MNRQHGPAGSASTLTYARAWVFLAASIVLVLLMGVFLSSTLATLTGGTKWVVHSEDVRFELARVLQSLSDLGGGVSGYAVTHDERLFEPAKAAADEIETEIAAVQRLVAEDAVQRPLAAELASLARQRESQTREQRERVLRGDLAGVQSEITSGEAKRVMDASRSLVARMQAEETRLLDYHGKATHRARDTVAFGIWATAFLAISLLISVAVVTVRDAERLRDVQEELAATERAARRALVDSSDALREADQRKDVFLATLSHELRNPLAPIRTATRLLETPNLPPADLEKSRLIISRQVRHMGSLLDDLLDISRITRGVLALRNERVDLRDVIEAAVETAQPLIAASGHRLSVEWPGVPIVLRADPLRLTQVLANLLTNAAKYTLPGGHITVAARLEAQRILILVRDDGIGIDAQMLPKVFDMFSQVDSGQEHSDGGLGIGLALVKGFVELHGGQVEAQSSGKDAGSEFIISLPASLVDSSPSPPAAAAPADEAPRPPQRSVLVADDNRDGADIMAMLLDQAGYEVHVAYTGLEALASAREHRPDVAILDIGMPGMSGYEVAAQIRADAWSPPIRLIAVTGWGQDDDRRKALEAGFDHHLTKPIDPAAVERLVALGSAR